MSKKTVVIVGIALVGAVLGRKRLTEAANSPKGRRVRRTAKTRVQQAAATGETIAQRVTEKAAGVADAVKARKNG